MENITVEEVKQINPRSRSGRKKIIGKTTADGKPEDPEYFKKYYEQNIKQSFCVMVVEFLLQSMR